MGVLSASGHSGPTSTLTPCARSQTTSHQTDAHPQSQTSPFSDASLFNCHLHPPVLPLADCSKSSSKELGCTDQARQWLHTHWTPRTYGRTPAGVASRLPAWVCLGAMVLIPKCPTPRSFPCPTTAWLPFSDTSSVLQQHQALVTTIT